MKATVGQFTITADINDGTIEVTGPNGFTHTQLVACGENDPEYATCIQFDTIHELLRDLQAAGLLISLKP